MFAFLFFIAVAVVVITIYVKQRKIKSTSIKGTKAGVIVKKQATKFVAVVDDGDYVDMNVQCGSHNRCDVEAELNPYIEVRNYVNSSIIPSQHNPGESYYESFSYVSKNNIS